MGGLELLFHFWSKGALNNFELIINLGFYRVYLC